MNSETSEKLQSILSKCDGFILDFDGLIADSEPFHYKAYNQVFERYGHSLNPEEYWVEFTSKGTGIQGEIERHNLKLNVTPQVMRQEKFEAYSRYCESGEISLFPDARDFLDLLCKEYKVAIASGSWEHDIRAILRHSNAENLVQTILGKSPKTRREKPFPDIFLEAAKELGLDPRRCVVVEDALKGLNAAHQANMPCIIIQNPLNESIDFSMADVVLPNLNQLTQILGSKK